MEKKLRKIIKYLSGLLAIVFLLLAFTAQSQSQRQNLEIDYLDVGQGDAILIKTPYQQNILIDGGPDNKILAQLGKNLSFFDKNIDLMILTHPHSDHVVGLIEILRRYNVKKVLLTGVKDKSPPYLSFLSEIQKLNVPFEKADGQKDFFLGKDLDLKILYPFNDISEREYENLNDTSIVAKLIYKNESFLFTGDAGFNEENELLNNKIDLRADVLKVGHHGSKYSSSQEFLSAVKPQSAVIEVGKDNDYGHPHLVTLKRLEQNNIEFLRTDYLGTIALLSDGTTINLKNKSPALQGSLSDLFIQVKNRLISVFFSEIAFLVKKVSL